MQFDANMPETPMVATQLAYTPRMIRFQAVALMLAASPIDGCSVREMKT